MPCFSSHNVRFTSAQQHHGDFYTTRERAKTAARLSHAFGSTLTTARRNSCHFTRSGSGNNQDLLFAPSRSKHDAKQHLRLQQNRPKTTTLSHTELERLKSAAKVITFEERLEELARREELIKQRDEQAERERQRFRDIDEERQRKLEADESNAEKDLRDDIDNQKLLERAFIAKHEQEEEVKAVNRIILNAKCHAVRDAQVQEKHDIERDYKNEEKRLERMVIEGAAKALARDDKTAEQHKVRNAKYAQEIRQQLEQRESLRFLEAERIEEEARIQREANAALKRDEERQAREATERRQQFRAELNGVVEMSNLFKKMLCEQEREAEMRMTAYMRAKQAREKQLQREKQLAKEEFGRQQQRLYLLSQKLNDAKTQRHELIYLREQERVEREYRRRELEAVMRKKQLERDIREARERQLQEAKSRQALQIAREEQDFAVLIENLKKEEARLKKEAEKREQQRKLYRTEIMQQMSDKMTTRRRLLEEERKDSKLWHETEKQRVANIKAVIAAKLTAMRAANLPERYIKDVEKQLERIIKPGGELKINK